MQLIVIYIPYIEDKETFNSFCKSLPRWRRGSRLDCGWADPGLNPGLPSPQVGPLMARRLKMSSDVLVPVSG